MKLGYLLLLDEYGVGEININSDGTEDEDNRSAIPSLQAGAAPIIAHRVAA
jgi:hypothetical protein